MNEEQKQKLKKAVKGMLFKPQVKGFGVVTRKTEKSENKKVENN
jgi:hypothetical protein